MTLTVQEGTVKVGEFKATDVRFVSVWYGYETLHLLETVGPGRCHFQTPVAEIERKAPYFLIETSSGEYWVFDAAVGYIKFNKFN